MPHNAAMPDGPLVTIGNVTAWVKELFAMKNSTTESPHMVP